MFESALVAREKYAINFEITQRFMAKRISLSSEMVCDNTIYTLT